MKRNKSTAVDIGIKNKRIFTDLAGIFTAITGMAVILMWLLWNGNLYGEYLLIHGKEVDATITEYEYFSEIVNIESENPSTISGWHNVYYYKDDANGHEYSGYCYWWKTAEDAENKLGTTIPIVIDTNSNHSTLGTKQQFNVHYDHERDLALAVSVSVLFLISLYVLIYRGIYRDKLDKKIVDRIGGTMANGFLGESYIVTGEVVCVFGLIWYYLKVAYEDKSGVKRKKWARAWFSRREAHYLKNKKFINIVPYKNTYGVLEKITVEK